MSSVFCFVFFFLFKLFYINLCIFISHWDEFCSELFNDGFNYSFIFLNLGESSNYFTANIPFLNSGRYKLFTHAQIFEICLGKKIYVIGIQAYTHTHSHI